MTDEELARKVEDVLAGRPFIVGDRVRYIGLYTSRHGHSGRITYNGMKGGVDVTFDEKLEGAAHNPPLFCQTQDLLHRFHGP